MFANEICLHLLHLRAICLYINEGLFTYMIMLFARVLMKADCILSNKKLFAYTLMTEGLFTYVYDNEGLFVYTSKKTYIRIYAHDGLL